MTVDGRQFDEARRADCEPHKGFPADNRRQLAIGRGLAWAVQGDVCFYSRFRGRTSPFSPHMSAFDPKRTSLSQRANL